MNSLAKTQREIIRQHDQTEDHELGQLGNSVGTGDIQLDLEVSAKKEKSRHFLPKIILFLVVIFILIAAVVLLVYFLKKDNHAKRGEVIKEVDNCEVGSVIFGQEIKIKCNLLDSTNKSIGEKFEAIYKNIADAKTSDFQCGRIKGTTSVECTAKELANCKSGGDVEIRFFNEDKSTIRFTLTVSIQTKGSIDTEIMQVYIGNTSQSTFQLKCTSSGYCSNPEMTFVENKTQKILADNVNCVTTYSIENGYVTSCNAEISSDVILNFEDKQTMLNCQIRQGKKIDNKEFRFPACNDYAAFKNECRFDCNNISSVLGNCEEVCRVAHECFSLRVQEFDRNSTSCAKECALKWCRDYDNGHIDTSGELSLNSICHMSPNR